MNQDMSESTTQNNISTREVLEEKILLQQELLRRRNLPINLYTPASDPERNQLAFHTSQARFRLALGGNQSGKSVCTSYEIAAYAIGEHRFRKIPSGPKEIYAISAEYRTLHRGLWRHLRPDAADHKGIGFLSKERIKRIGPTVPGPVPIPAFVEVYSGQRRVNGEWPVSTITFISGEGGESARRKVQAAAIDLAVLDEEIDDTMSLEVKMRLLTTNGDLISSASLIRGEQWLLDLEDEFDAGSKKVFIVRLNSEHNPYISQEARDDLLKGLSDEDRAVRVLGQSRRRFGLVYNKFNPAVNTYDPSEITIQNDWPRFSAFDPGYRVFAGLWVALDPTTGSMYVYREMYERESDLDTVANFISNAEGFDLKEIHARLFRRQPRPGVTVENPERLIDPAAARHLETGEPGILTQLAGVYGICCAPAVNAVDPGINAVRRLLAPNETGHSALRISTDCINTLKEIRGYKIARDKTKNDSNERLDAPVRRNNHACDCLRYLAARLMHLSPKRGQPYRTATPGRYATSMQYKYLDTLKLLGDKTVCHETLGSEW